MTEVLEFLVYGFISNRKCAVDTCNNLQTSKSCMERGKGPGDSKETACVFFIMTAIHLYPLIWQTNVLC